MGMFSAPDDYDRFMGRYAVPLARAFADAADITPGLRVLDVGCGPGALTAELVGRVGATRVAAVDPSAPAVDVCAERNPGVDVRVSGGEHLPFPDGTFDRTLAQLVVNFFSDPDAGVAEMRRVTRPGGLMGATTWDIRDGMTLLRTIWESASALDPAAAEFDERRQSRFCTPEDLGALWEGAGLQDVEVTTTTVATTYESMDDLWSTLEAGVGPAGGWVTSLSDDGRAALREEFRSRLGAGEGVPLELTARAWIAVGTVA
jgi:SAM-dependent methyltransferase